VDTTSLSEADLAEYHLLKVMTDYIVLHQADGDSLVTTCVDYYDKHGDAWHRGRAYYYRAGIRRHLLGETYQAIKDYKTAETIAENADDELLKNMVYENLAFANYRCINYSLGMRYSQKFLESSVKLNDTIMVIRGLQMCAASYAQMNLKDSAYACILKSLDYIDLCDSILRSDIYHNVVVMYQEKGDDENAQKYLDIWKQNRSASSTKGYISEARLLKAQGRYEEAIEKAKACYTEGDPLVRINSMELLAELYELAGEKSEALETKKQVDAYRDSVMTANHSIEIADWQQKYDEERWRATTMSTNVKWGGVIWQLIYSFHMALFFMISGFLSYKDSGVDKVGNFVIKKEDMDQGILSMINKGLIPHSVDIISTDNPNEIDIMIHFDTPVYLDEIEEIKNIFLYYETLKGYINQHLNDF
jgi:tetratricopeptide (TPR) repeat protein